MMAANIHPGTKCLVLDETRGLISLAILERLGGKGLLMTLHEHELHNLDILQFQNRKEEDRTFYPMNFNLLDASVDEKFEDRDFPDQASRERAIERFNKRISLLQETKQLYESTSFNCLVICSFQYKAVDMLKKFTVKLAGSSPIVLYHPYKDALLEAYQYCRKSNEYIDVQMTETFMREYQPIPGRIHPTMQTSGNSGFLLSMIRVFE